MLDLTIKLGSFTFQNAEVAQKISFGGSQRTAVHKLIGGGRIIDAMGRDDIPLAWSGIFLSATAMQRARQLDAFRIAGAPLKLTFRDLSYQVVVSSFQADFERYYKIPYSISCEVIADNARPSVAGASQGILASLTADLAAVQSLVNLVSDNPLIAAVTKVQAVLSQIPGGSKLSKSIQGKLLDPIGAAQNRANVLIGLGNNTLIAGASVSNAASIVSQSASMSQMSNLLNINGILGRMSNNVQTASGGTAATVASGSLYDVANRQYGDATKWTDIAAANGLTDPVISGQQTLILPTITGNGGGVLLP